MGFKKQSPGCNCCEPNFLTCDGLLACLEAFVDPYTPPGGGDPIPYYRSGRDIRITVESVSQKTWVDREPECEELEPSGCTLLNRVFEYCQPYITPCGVGGWRRMSRFEYFGPIHCLSSAYMEWGIYPLNPLTPDNNVAIFVNISAGSFGPGTFADGAQFGWYQSDEGTDAQAALTALCRGEEITLPLRVDFPDAYNGCDFSTAVVKIQLLPGGTLECAPETDPPDDPPPDPPPPPPPPPDPPDCSGLSECPDMPDATLFLFGFEDYTETTSGVVDPGFPYGDFYIEWFPENLNGSFVLPYLDSTSYEFYLPLIPVDGDGDPILGDYANPGELLRRRTAVDDITYPHTFDEWYAYGIHIKITCADGVAALDFIRWDVQQFILLYTDDPMDTPYLNSSGTIVYSTVFSTSGSGTSSCATPEILGSIDYQDVLTSGAGDSSKIFYAIARIWGGA